MRTEEIYDAILDDELFEALPAALNKAYGARSCTLHWRHPDGAPEIMSHSGHFSDEQMLNYATNFAEADLWSLEALQPSRVNQVWNCDELVSEKAYAGSIFYNEWIRQMGDDTFHCTGIVLKSRWGCGVVGLHRGRTQGGFSAENLQALSNDIPDIRRMMILRGRLSQVTNKARHAEAILDTMGQTIVSTDAKGHVLSLNQAAEGLIGRQDGLIVRRGCLYATVPAADRRLKEAIAAAASHRFAGALAIPRRDGGSYELTIVPLRNGYDRRQVLITIQDNEVSDSTVESRLRNLYGLTRTEADVAVRLAGGECPTDIAERREVAINTVRTQIKSVYQKMGCRRQAELVASVKRLPPISQQ